MNPEFSSLDLNRGIAMKYLRMPSQRKSILATLAVAMMGIRPSQGAAPTIDVRYEGTNVVIHFGGRLEASAHFSGPYTIVTGARSPYPTAATSAPQQFWLSPALLLHPR